ncbi:uncharacterized conserved protein [Brachybacterium faecium DSM 4810]|uniref:Uncharacterized conserved protein n=1 Tax=Brachybacterium faecium (strain ATCC 43885 / DSM 4810 / JCM 11609 / LMG 19847 / NBRC 14762 / NCIMB 9860 / 6-10) TaxID=446465 RepID=C7MAT9_BRAFD|nr:DUF488 domain-containing protein [Brachybacterium faecium]ACU86826.1 uncharacterized conserved protein [Brachybacterium faecium DSM 4810]
MAAPEHPGEGQERSGGQLLTLGHGRLEREELAALLTEAGIGQLVDVRRFPGSRTNDAAARGVVEEICTAAGIGYRWDERLGGRRRLTAQEDADSPDPWWRVAQFRAYASWTRSEEFRAGIQELLGDVARTRTAVMCSEAVWWRCHRRLIADVMVLEHGVEVLDLMHSGQQRPHEPSAGARRDADGHVVWDRPDDNG